jgi:hypothetical protein
LRLTNHQAIIQNSSIEPKNKGEKNSKHMPLIIVGVIAVVIGSVLVGYL